MADEVPQERPGTVDRWVLDERLPARDALPVDRACGWGTVKVVNDVYAEFCVTPDQSKVVFLWFGIFWFLLGAFACWMPVDMTSAEKLWPLWLLLLAAPWFLLAAFFFRVALRAPEERIARFNRQQRKIFVNDFTWNRNPFGRWRSEAKVLEWSNVHAEIVRHENPNELDEIVVRYSLELTDRDPMTNAENERVRLRSGEQFKQPLMEQWEYMRQYMNEGTASLPNEALPQPEAMADELFVCLPWLAPSAKGRSIRSQMGIGLWSLTLPFSLMFPLCLLIGAGSLALKSVAPISEWPDGMDEASRR